MDIAQLKQYSQYFRFACLALYLGLLFIQLATGDEFKFPELKEIIAFIGAFFLGMFVSDMKNRVKQSD